MLPTLYAAKINEIILPPRFLIATHAQIDVKLKKARQNNATLFSFFQSNVHDKDERNCSKMGSRGKNTGQ